MGFSPRAEHVKTCKNISHNNNSFFSTPLEGINYFQFVQIFPGNSLFINCSDSHYFQVFVKPMSQVSAENVTLHGAEK